LYLTTRSFPEPLLDCCTIEVVSGTRLRRLLDLVEIGVVGRGVEDLARVWKGRISATGLDVRELTNDSTSLSDVSEADDDWQNSRRRGRDVSAAGEVAKCLYCGRFFVIGDAEWPLAAKKSERAISINLCERAVEEKQARSWRCPGRISKR
jgi:hypothetical protein